MENSISPHSSTQKVVDPYIFRNNGKLQHSLQKCAIWLFCLIDWPPHDSCPYSFQCLYYLHLFSVRLRIIYLVETEIFLLKVLWIKVNIS